MNKLLYINVLAAIALTCCCLSGIAGPEDLQERVIDLSTPEKTLSHFYEAFRTGNASLLSLLLINGGSVEQFGPPYQIDIPNPIIAGAEIVKKTTVRTWSGDGEPIEAGDVLVYVLTRKDPKRVVRKPGVAMPEEKFCFLVRKTSGQWKLVKVYPGWPTFLNR